MSNLPQSQTKMVVYRARDGQEVQLTVDLVRNFLVTGKKELVTLQEFVYFMGVCKSRGLNPFAKDCYLIKYTENDPAAIVTSIDFYRSRARAQADCTGWEKGVICLNEQTGELRYSKGLVLPGEKLLGGWFRAKPKGWEVPFELEVNLEGYIKRTKDGKVTQFWAPEKQATMIAKVAESQGLRALWPDEFRGTVTAEEANVQIENLETVDIETLTPSDEEVPDTEEFNRLAEPRGMTADRWTLLEKFVEECARANSRKGQKPVTPTDIKLRAIKDFERFWNAFEFWEAKNRVHHGEDREARKEEARAEDMHGDADGQPEEHELSAPDAGQAPETAPHDNDGLKARLQAIYNLAVQKQIVGQVLSQFKVNNWNDFLAFPELIPSLEDFVSQYQAPKAGGRKK